MSADPATKARTDAVTILNEADPTVLEELYQHYRQLMAKYGVVCGTPRKTAGPESYHLSTRFFETTSSTFKY